MFASLAHLIPHPPPPSSGPPQDVPPPTPIHFPQCRPPVPSSDLSEAEPSTHLTTLLQSLVRPADQVEITHLEALGVHVNPDVSPAALVPDPSCLPDFSRWDGLSQGDAHAIDAELRPALCNGRLAPGPSKYVDLRQSLLTENDRAFRAVRRVAPKPGEQYVRLGYCHDFFRCLEPLTGFWDDPSATRSSTQPGENAADGVAGNTEAAVEANGAYAFYRTSAGTSMPPQYRMQLLTSFLKLVTYDFSCSVTSRQEPRLYLKSPGPDHRHSYLSSGCNFVYRMPVDRESAKHGIIEGPLAAVSPRHSTVFPPEGGERESVIDLSREIIAALITAQHRAREGRQEERIGKDAWWATRPRWGGGPGGPIGKETEVLESKDATAILVGDKDEKPTSDLAVEGEGTPPSKHNSAPATTGRSSLRNSAPRGSSSRTLGGSSPPQPPNPKRPRKGLAVYDAYRMVRPPSMNWDPKTRYDAIGRQRGADYDDVFVISCLFHHISIMRVRVPDRLLEVLGGSVPDPGVGGRGRLEVWRTRWYDFFIAQDRIEAMRAIWAIMAYAMRNVQDVVADEEDSKPADDEAKGEGLRK